MCGGSQAGVLRQNLTSSCAWASVSGTTGPEPGVSPGSGTGVPFCPQAADSNVGTVTTFTGVVGDGVDPATAADDVDVGISAGVAVAAFAGVNDAVETVLAELAAGALLPHAAVTTIAIARSSSSMVQRACDHPGVLAEFESTTNLLANSGKMDVRR